MHVQLYCSASGHSGPQVWNKTAIFILFFKFLISIIFFKKILETKAIQFGLKTMFHPIHQKKI